MKVLVKIFGVILLLIVIAGVLLYSFQEKLIFFPNKTAKESVYNFDIPYKEINYKVDDATLNALFFPAENSKGVIFYNHGNAGNLESWGNVAKFYQSIGYDVLLYDYRGFGKITGSIKSQEQLFEDANTIYQSLKKKYKEHQIIVLGYSIGTGIAANIASKNTPRMLILQAPYYNLTEMLHANYSFLPDFMLRYKLATNEYLKNFKSPIIIFHGNTDEVIDFNNSKMLEKEFKKGDQLIMLNNQGHNNMTDNPEYQEDLAKILH